MPYFLYNFKVLINNFPLVPEIAAVPPATCVGVEQRPDHRAHGQPQVEAGVAPAGGQLAEDENRGKRKGEDVQEVPHQALMEAFLSGNLAMRIARLEVQVAAAPTPSTIRIR